MPLKTPQEVAPIVLWETQRTKGYPLVDLHVVPNHGRLSDHDARPMVDEEVPAYGCTGVYVDPGHGMRILRHDPGKQGNALDVEFMGNPVNHYGLQTRIAENHLVETLSCRITVEGGRFVVGGERVKIWGVNLCFGACFPEAKDAERIAARMAAAGVNSVRFHHMDTGRFPRGILDPKDALKLHPEALDRLDVFLDQLARRGIRANLNLHVGREASAALGLPRPNTRYDKIVGIFTPRLIEAQKQYARDLLTRVNTVRKVRYADDPAVAFVEITNEDSLFMWSAARDLRTLPEHYAGVLQGQFCRWLKGRYGSTQGVRAAWAKGSEPLGENLLADTEFKMPKVADHAARHWAAEMHDGCRLKVVHPPDHPKAVRLEIEKLSGGEDYDGQPGDDGVTVYLKPLDKVGDIVKALGDIRIQLYDLANPPGRNLVGEYHFPAKTVGDKWHGKLMTYHYTLKCPWQRGAPEHSEITIRAVFRDYLTGHVMSTQTTCTVRPPP